MKDSIKNILIGLFCVGAITILVSMILFLDPKVGDGRKTIKVRFANIAGISDGTRVTYAGKAVGEVISIHEIPHARSERIDETGRIYCYLLTLKIDSSVVIYDSDEIAIRSTGLMGEKSIAILPKAPLLGKTAQLITDEVLIANSIDPLENTFNQVSKTASQMQTVLLELNQWFKQSEKPLTHTLDSLHSAVDQANKTITAFHSEGTQTLQNINQITQDLLTGSGTLGRFLNQDDVYLRVNSLLSKTEALLNDINHYGLLFQYDKHWQRSRMKRANILKSLSSARDFRDYFESEIDGMNTSLGRLTELLDQAESEGHREQIARNSEFKRQFAHLLRQLDALAGSMKLYNEELSENVGEEP